MGMATYGIDAVVEEGNKFDDDKARYDLLPGYALDQVVGIFTYGSKKYGDRNWEKGISWSRLFAATMRHLWAFWRGEDNDEESGLHHLAHAACDIMMLLQYSKHQKTFDNRR